MDAARADAIDEREAVEPGQHHIDNGGVVGSRDGQVDAPLAVGRDVDREAGFGQPLATKSAIVASSSTMSTRTIGKVSGTFVIACRGVAVHYSIVELRTAMRGTTVQIPQRGT